MSTIPVFIPFVNRFDLLEKAIASVPRRMTTEPVVINNSGADLEVRCDVVTPIVPLTFAQSQNAMLSIAKRRRAPFYFFLHSDAEAAPDTVELLWKMAMSECSKGKWGAIFTAYDALAAFNTAAFESIGGWDTMLSWYLSDCDVYRRLRLAGYPTLESNLPVKHTPSSTLNSDMKIAYNVQLEVDFRTKYYAAKWGGTNDHETFDTPWGRK